MGTGRLSRPSVGGANLEIESIRAKLRGFKHWQLREAKFVTISTKSSSKLCCNIKQFFFPKTRKHSPLSILNAAQPLEWFEAQHQLGHWRSPGYFTEAYLSLEHTQHVPHALEDNE
jgi:hypothetical protein